MTRLISDILDAQEPHFTHNIHRLEKISGMPKHDLRLLSDIATLRKNALRELNLDENDTTARELYFALRHKAEETNSDLEKYLGIEASDSPDKLIKKIIKFVEKTEKNKKVWALKQVFIKQHLKKQPPKKLMKVLGLRSIDSVLKRESPCELLTLGAEIENPDWMQKFRNNYRKVQSSDFNTVKSSILFVSGSKAKKMRKNGIKKSKIILSNIETSSVIVIEPDERFKLDTLAITLSILQSLQDIRVFSAYFRHISVSKNFGTNMINALNDGLPGSKDKKTIGWKPLQLHLMKNESLFESLEQPHLQFEDLTIENPIQYLKDATNNADFWLKHHYIFMPDAGNNVSLHLMDVIINTSNDLDFENSVYPNLKSNLWDELNQRYIAHEPVRLMVIETLT